MGDANPDPIRSKVLHEVVALADTSAAFLLEVC